MLTELNHMSQPIGPIVADWKAPPMPLRVVMPGRYCRLEPLEPERHAESLFAANALDERGMNWTYLPYGPFERFDDYRVWLEHQSQAHDPLFYAVVDHSSDAAVGVASYLRITPASGSIEVGHLNFSPRLQRTPAATEAMYLMMSHAFELGYRRYEWKCDALNAPSRTAAMRLGLSFEGIFRQATVAKGRNRDTAWYSVIDSEWSVLREAFQTWMAPSNFDESGQQHRRLSDLTSQTIRQV